MSKILSMILSYTKIFLGRTRNKKQEIFHTFFSAYRHRSRRMQKERTHLVHFLLLISYFLFFLFGTGSYPPLPKGLHRRIRHMVRARPMRMPHSMTASMQYWEQVGVKRQEPCPFRGERYFLYRCTGMRNMRHSAAWIRPAACPTGFRSGLSVCFIGSCCFLRQARIGVPAYRRAFPVGPDRSAGLFLHPAFSLPQPWGRG